MPRREETSKTGIAVIESRWFPGKNVTVAPLFNLLGDLFYENPNAYHYEMVGCEAAFKECLPRIASDRKLKYAYIAMHGSEKGLHLHNDQIITRTEVRNLLRSISGTHGSSLKGLYFGSCLFGTQALAGFLYSEISPVRWIAGYNQTVNWIDSYALDLQFFSLLLSSEQETERLKVVEVSEKLKSKCAGLIQELGFGIYARKQGGIGSVKNLLEA